MSRVRALLIFVLCLPPCLFGSVMERLNLQQLAYKADLIAIGRVVRLDTLVESGEPWTLATVTMEKQMKGDRQSTIQIRMPGGMQKIGNRTLVTEIEGVPLPNINERAVVFLTGKDKSRLALTGLGQGYWKIEIDQEGREVAGKSERQRGSTVHLDRLIQEIQNAIRDAKKR